MTRGLSTWQKLATLSLINLACSVWLVYGEGFDPLPVFTMPFAFGFTMGILTLNHCKKPVINSIVIGLVFLGIFLVSSLGMIWLSKQFFGTDDALPFLSTPFSVALILLILSRFQIIKVRVLTFLAMIALGIGATFLGNYFSQLEIANHWSVLTSIPFLWQSAIGTVILLQHENQKKHTECYRPRKVE